MKNIISIIMAVVFTTLLVGCGEVVEVPPAHVGKVLGKNGYNPVTLSPSKFRLEMCFRYCDNLVLLEAADTGFKESMVVFLPLDKIEITVEVRGTLSIPTTPSMVDSIYSRITSRPLSTNNRISIISGKKVYDTYGAQALRGVVRSELVKHSISDIMSQRESIGTNIHAAVQEKMEITSIPLTVSRFELADIQPPPVILQAQLAAKEREIDIQTAEADAEVKLVEANLALEVAKKNRLVDREKAEAMAEQNEIASASITPQVLEYKRLETAITIYTALAQSSNVVIIPADSRSFQDISSDAVMAKMLGKELK